MTQQHPPVPPAPVPDGVPEPAPYGPAPANSPAWPVQSSGPGQAPPAQPWPYDGGTAPLTPVPEMEPAAAVPVPPEGYEPYEPVRRDGALHAPGEHLVVEEVAAPPFEAERPEIEFVPEPGEAPGLEAGPRRKSLMPWVNGIVFALAVYGLWYWPIFSYVYVPMAFGSVGRFLVQTMISTLCLAIAAMGLNLVAGYTGMLSLGHAGFVGIGALTMVGLTNAGLNPWLAMPVAIVAGGIVGGLVALPSARVKGFYLSIITFTFGFMLGPIVGLFSSNPAYTPQRRLPGLYPEEGLIDLGFAPAAAYQIRFYWFAAFCAIATFVFMWFLVRSRLGRAWKAIRESDIAARACGISVFPFKVLAFVVSAAMAAFGGALLSQDPNRAQVSVRDFDFLMSFTLVFFVVLGGIGTVSGPLIGSVILGVVLPFVFSDSITGIQSVPGATSIVLGTLLILNVVLAPNGAVGMLGNARHRVEKASLKAGRPPRRPKDPVPAATDLAPRPRHDPMTLQGQPMLELRSASKIFGGLRAVDSVDMVVWPGNIHSLIGPNGSGKTTTINLVTGFYEADEGRVIFKGQDVTSERSTNRAHRGMTRTFQNLQIWRDMTVLENVMIGMTPLPGKGGGQSAKKRAFGLLDYVGMAHKAHDPAGSLALAELRYLEIARALAADPDLLLLDEPAAGMNPAETHELTRLIRDVNDHGITVLLIEHHMDVVMELSDDITVLDFGAKIAEGTPGEIQNDPKVIEAYLGAEA